MSFIIYSTLVQKALEEGANTQEKIMQYAANKFEFPEKNLIQEINRHLEMFERKRDIKINKNGEIILINNEENHLTGKTALTALNMYCEKEFLNQNPHYGKFINYVLRGNEK